MTDAVAATDAREDNKEYPPYRCLDLVLTPRHHVMTAGTWTLWTENTVGRALIIVTLPFYKVNNPAQQIFY